ncbi:C4-dicarboxylate ABC transporter permease [Oscillospiraceae bacterium]|nr:C4-dicarboxylate ABC transporter permease [Oscillospiraceae bacterium]BDF76432.1 C4-dicarboxylate ABC transporter permease [Oscillospiraceae bacterium]
MDMITSVLSGLFTLENLLWINIGMAGGIIVGALPGLTGTMCIALLLPLTYGLNPITGILLLLGVYCGGIYGGSITAILINTPGTPASAATALDGYQMAKKGHGLRALHDALSASTIGGLFSCVVLLFAAPPIAAFALKFGPSEYFALALFGLTIIASVGGKSQIKGLLMGFVGLLISCVGIDPMDGVSRFTFGINRMQGGIDTIPVLIGLFAITEIMNKGRDLHRNMGAALKVEKEKIAFRDVLKYKLTLLKSSILGVFIGAVPGTGAAISSFLAYNEAKRCSKTPEAFGHGCEEAVVASESANNAVTGATLIPLLTLGIPGDTNTAVLLGALTMQGIAAGPQLFVQQKEWVYTIMIGLIVVNLFMYLQGRLFIRGFVNITKIPTHTLVPILVVLCVIGAYAIDYSVFNAILMVVIGIFGYFVTKLDFPLTPMVIGLVLGKLCESNLRRALIVSKGNWSTFFTSPIACFFIALSVVMLVLPYVKKKLDERKAARQ